MGNKLKTIIENIEEGEILMLGDQTFLNKIILDESLQYSVLGTIIFFEVDFKRIDFTRSTFVNCEFKNYKFKDVILRKCNFLNVNLRASDFSDFEFIETTFNNNDLDLIGAQHIKVSISNQSIDIEKSSNLEKILKDMN